VAKIYPDYQVVLGHAAKARRVELRLTQEEISLEHMLAQGWVSHFENGRSNVTYFNLRRLAAALGLKPSELLARAEQMEAQPGAGLAETGAKAKSTEPAKGRISVRERRAARRKESGGDSGKA
jgi:transcriptional regulator with XRE-family HTH domain